eukprot:g40243.t1
MEHEQSEFLSREPDIYALAPYLDLLNHSPSAQVRKQAHVQKASAVVITAAFNQKTKHYEIRTVTKCRRYEQVFICYGPHDNQRLLLEYGFLTNSNPHNVVYVSKGQTAFIAHSLLPWMRRCRAAILNCCSPFGVELLCNHVSEKYELVDRKLQFLQDEGLL